jgi:hypothetical protein
MDSLNLKFSKDFWVFKHMRWKNIGTYFQKKFDFWDQPHYSINCQIHPWYFIYMTQCFKTEPVSWNEKVESILKSMIGCL